MSSLPDVPRLVLDAATAGPVALRAALDEAGGAPLRQGRMTTFLYLGEAEAVGLHHWMDVFPRLPAFTRHAETRLWTLTVELPQRSRIEYKLSVKSRGRRRLVLDHLNPRRARNPFGTNSVVTGARYARPEWSCPKARVAAGTIRWWDIESPALGDTRRAGLYVPAHAGSEPLGLLVAHDGSDYVDYAALGVVLDNLIAAGEIPPLACVLTDPRHRNREYAADDRHADHLAHELIPSAAEQAAIDIQRVVALGASLGGVAALHAAWRHPGTFSGLILQSGSFVTALGGRHRRGATFAPVVDFMARFAAAPGPLPPRIHMSCGQFDGLIEENRSFAERLRTLGLAVGFEEAPDGHDWENWRDRLRGGLLYVTDE